MRFFSRVRNAPVLLLVVVLIGFGLWVASDLPADRPPPSPMGGPPQMSLAAPEELSASLPTSGPLVVTPEMVSRLQPGMTRSEVEAVIGPPPAELVHPVAVVNGKHVYQADYLANLDAPQFGTRMAGGRSVPVPVVPKTLIAVEFDASRPGHPLLKIHPSISTRKES